MQEGFDAAEQQPDCRPGAIGDAEESCSSI
jgi:hypothetical protein